MMNRVILVGRLTKDPELRYTPNGVAVASFTIAVNRTFTNAQGEREADFINCVVWRKPAENLANYQKKGNLIGVDGRLQSRSYEGQDGRRVYVTEVMSENIQYLEPKKNGNSGDGQYSSYQNQRNQNNGDNGNSYNQNQNQNQRQQPPQQEFDMDDNPFNSKPIDISDDDLPF